MHRDEAKELSACADCGAEILPGSERAFGFGDGEVLCWDCAVRRGGSYDAGEDRWVKTPSLKGISGPRP